MRVAACQMNSRQDKTSNLAAALDLLDRAAGAGAELAVLPEYLDYLALPGQKRKFGKEFRGLHHRFGIG